MLFVDLLNLYLLGFQYYCISGECDLGISKYSEPYILHTDMTQSACTNGRYILFMHKHPFITIHL